MVVLMVGGGVLMVLCLFRRAQASACCAAVWPRTRGARGGARSLYRASSNSPPATLPAASTQSHPGAQSKKPAQSSHLIIAPSPVQRRRHVVDGHVGERRRVALLAD